MCAHCELGQCVKLFLDVEEEKCVALVCERLSECCESQPGHSPVKLIKFTRAQGRVVGPSAALLFA